jgi:acyl dehydratase
VHALSLGDRRGGKRDIGPFLLGRSHLSSDYYEVGREKIREYAASVKDPHPAHRCEDSAAELGYDGLITSPTFLCMWAWNCMIEFLEAEGVGLDLRQLVHTEQEFRYHQPIQSGDRLRGQFHVDVYREKGPTATIRVRTEVSKLHGELVAEVVTTLVKHDRGLDIEIPGL